MKTTSYKISKQLTKAGFEAETDFYWAKWNEGDPELVHAKDGTPPLIEKVLAWDLETILEALPESVKFHNKSAWFEMDKNFIIYKFIDEDKTCLFDFHKQENESLADTAARLLIKLESKGLINFKK